MKKILLLLVLFSPPSASATVFDDAQIAARDGRYGDVVALLGDALAAGTLSKQESVAAYANRGIASGLLGDYAAARSDLTKAHELDPSDNLTLNHLGLLAEKVDQDYAGAAEWYQQAADAGFAASQVNLANLYRDGRGVSTDMKLAFSLYKEAAGPNYPAASLQVAAAYEAGTGVKQDLTNAAHYYQIAANAGDPEAQNKLGYLYRTGQGVTKDFVEAAKWYRMSADQGVTEAINRLAWLLATCPIESVCDGATAITLAQTAVEQGRTASCLDTLAAAYARAGKFDEAVNVMQQVIDEFAQNAPDRHKFETRLDRYRNGIPTQL